MPASSHRAQHEQRSPPERSNRLLDPLTGLPTQRALTLRLEKLIAGETSRPASLALLQLANFYEIRARLGNTESDCLLREVAGALASSLPGKATLYRCENHEFAVLLQDEHSVDASRLGAALAASLNSAGRKYVPPHLELKCVAGLATLNGSTRNAHILFARARHSLSQSRYQSTDNATEPGASSRALTPSILCRVLKSGGPRHRFQPVLCWEHDGLRRFEMRSCLEQEGHHWGGHQLYEIAVSNALGECLDRLAIVRALKLLSAPGNEPLHLTVNLSLNSVVSPGFLGWLKTQLMKTVAPRSRLCLQLSEIDLLIAQHHVASFSYGLKLLGTELSVRHFGCFDDPVGYLSLLRCNWVRLDASLLQGLSVNGEQFERLQELVRELAKRDVRVMAGMLEDILLLPLLWRSGVRAVQGNCIGRSKSSPDFAFPEEYSAD